ncbi:MAG: 8-amino-7-oxononanoate synthase [Micropepsaceae bacterium]
MTGLDQFASGKLAEAEARSLFRALAGTPANALNFCSNDYLALSADERLVRAAASAAERFGVGAGASRLVTGNHPLYAELESRIAVLKGTESALVFGAGYLANLGTIPALAGEGDLIVADELSHACMMSGAKLSGARTLLFRHNDVEHLELLLKGSRTQARNCLVMTEGVFSMDGDRAPLADIANVTRKYDAWLMTDDAHGFGVLGEGRGSAHAAGVRPDVQMGTLSKAVGSYGGYVAGSRSLVSLLVNRARSVIYSTGLPPSVVGASIAGLDVISGDAKLCARPVENAALFCKALNLPRPESAIVPLVLGESDAAVRAAQLLEREGFIVRAIRPPTVPDGTARLRVTFTAGNKNEDILRLAATVREFAFPLMSV